MHIRFGWQGARGTKASMAASGDSDGMPSTVSLQTKAHLRTCTSASVPADAVAFHDSTCMLAAVAELRAQLAALQEASAAREAEAAAEVAAAQASADAAEAAARQQAQQAETAAQQAQQQAQEALANARQAQADIDAQGERDRKEADALRKQLKQQQAKLDDERRQDKAKLDEEKRQLEVRPWDSERRRHSVHASLCYAQRRAQLFIWAAQTAACNMLAIKHCRATGMPLPLQLPVISCGYAVLCTSHALGRHGCCGFHAGACRSCAPCWTRDHRSSTS